MSLGQGTIQRLKILLRDATALVFVDDKPVGTAFFISDDLLLTCAHVVTGQSAVEIKLVGRPRRPADVIGTHASDLALLRSHRVDQPQKCVVLDGTLYPGDCFVAGFPREPGQPPGLDIFDVEVSTRIDAETGGDQVIEIQPGKIVTWGMSGGPVVSVQSGAVIGIIRISKNPTDALGGGAIPVSQAAGVFGRVAEILPESMPAMVPWRDALGPDHWQQLGKKSWSTEEHIDLQVSGRRNRWLVSMVQAAGPGLDLTGPDLGEGIAEAIFHWAQRRHPSSDKEVALLGQLLASALFPPSMVHHLRVADHADSIVVRLHVEHGNDLADIPWELAAVPGESERFLAADQQFRFVRVVDNPAVRLTRVVPKAPDSIRVLAAVAQPALWQFPEVHGRYDDPYEWPSATKMAALLREGIARKGFQAREPPSLRYSDVRSELMAPGDNGRPYDVLHYMGTGWWADGKAHLAFARDDGGAAWVELSTILGIASRASVRLIVLELMLPPTGRNYEPLSLGALSDVVGGSVNAAVLTNRPVHPGECYTFNNKFYEELGNGEPVAAAVQLARARVKEDKPVEDAAGFGWFTVVTGPQSDVYLVSRPPMDPTISGVRRPAAADRPADGVGQ